MKQYIVPMGAGVLMIMAATGLFIFKGGKIEKDPQGNPIVKENPINPSCLVEQRVNQDGIYQKDCQGNEIFIDLEAIKASGETKKERETNLSKYLDRDENRTTTVILNEDGTVKNVIIENNEEI